MTGTMANSPTQNQSPLTGHGGKSIRFLNANGSGIDFGDVYDFTGTASFTALAFVQPLNYFENYFWSNADATARGWHLRIEANPAPVWTMRRGDNAGFDTVTYQDTEANFESGAVRMVAMRYDGTNMVLNINGNDVAQGASAKSVVAATTNTVMRFGAYSAGGNGYDGFADDLAIFSAALTRDELYDIFAASNVPRSQALDYDYSR